MLEIGFDSSLLTSSSDLLSAVCAAEEGTCKKAKSVKRTSDRVNRFFTGPPIHRGSLPWMANVASSLHRSISFRHQYLAGSAIDVEQPEGCHVLLQNHRDHADAGCKKVVPSVMCMSRTDSALALDAEQDRRERAGRYRYLIGADIGVGAVDCS